MRSEVAAGVASPVSELTEPPGEAVGVIELDEVVPRSLLRRLSSEITAAADARWWMGFGPSSFVGRLPTRPRALEHLRLNGDDRFGLDPDGQGALVLILDGAWDAVVEGVRATKRRAGRTWRACHLGKCQETRDHTGFLDGTSNLQELPAADFGECVRVSSEDDPAWAGATYLVMRKYREDLHLWNDLPVSVQETIIGRRRSDGAFLDGRHDWTPATWDVTHPRAHVRCVRPRAVASEPWQERLFRRSATFVEPGNDGGIHAGLLFLALCRDPVRQFVRIHNERLLPATGPADLLFGSGYVRPVASGCFLVPTPATLMALLDE